MEPKITTQLYNNMPPNYFEKGLRTNPLQRLVHAHRFTKVSQLIDSVGGEVLDIGSADGTLTQIIANKTKAKKIVGVDILKSSISYAQKKFQKDNKMEFLVADAHKLPFKNNRFEAVFCLEVLDLVINPSKVLSEIKRVVKPNGYIVIGAPTDNFLFKLAWMIVLRTWGKYWQGARIHNFNQPNSLAKLIQKAGFKIIKDNKYFFNMLELVKALNP